MTQKELMQKLLNDKDSEILFLREQVVSLSNIILNTKPVNKAVKVETASESKPLSTRYMDFLTGEIKNKPATTKEEQEKKDKALVSARNYMTNMAKDLSGVRR